MHKLPDWLARLTETVPGWVDRLAHPDGPGRYRFALDAYEPYDLDSSQMIHNIVCTVHGDVPPDQRAGWIDYLLDMQRPADGLLIDPAMERHILPKHGSEVTQEDIDNVRRFTSRNALSSVVDMGGKPRYALAHDEAFETPDEIVAYMESLDWSNPWSVGSWAGAVLLFQHFNRLLGAPRADEIIEAGVRWLAEHQDPATGAWHDGTGRMEGGEIAINVLINGIFKVWIQVLPIADLPVQYADRVIDLCLHGLAEEPALKDTPDSCSIFDVALVLDVAVRFTDHRREEVAAVAARHLPMLEPMARADGAFSYHPGKSLLSHGGLALAPVKDQSDATGTAVNANACALLCNLCGLRDELGWSPVTEWRMGLD